MGRHEFLLEVSTDGRICDAERARARGLDAATRALAPAAEIAIGRVELKPREIVRRMARVIAQAAPARGMVHVKDFERAGIARGDAERHFVAALNRARCQEPAIEALERAA